MSRMVVPFMALHRKRMGGSCRDAVGAKRTRRGHRHLLADAAPEPQHARVDYAITIERGARGAAAPFANLPLSAAIPKTLRLEIEILP